MSETNDRIVRPTTSVLTWANRWDHILARWAINRMGHRVEPGLYALGNPTQDSPVFVTANYTLSFDALRSALGGMNAYILVLDTQAINVWCAAGKGTFGTDELAQRIEATGLRDRVSHRVVIAPQLGAPGIAAHEIKKRTSFKVEYGPVRAADLSEYLTRREATPEMRRVRFTLRDRLAVIPVEIVGGLIPLLIGAAVAYLFGGWVSSLAVVAAILAGVVVFPILLPWLPTHDFSAKGFLLGALVALPLVVSSWQGNADAVGWLRAGKAIVPLLIFPPITAFLALNFTGSTTFTSRSGVQREIFTYVPVMAWMFAIGIALMIGLPIIRMIGG
ncbi:MAG: carbon monoxide dehydrogenase [Chloroflexi bacterium]|nr:carbon monoxide dehydrogenase [Chloroflexota bacterium]